LHGTPEGRLGTANRDSLSRATKPCFPIANNRPHRMPLSNEVHSYSFKTKVDRIRSTGFHFRH